MLRTLFFLLLVVAAHPALSQKICGTVYSTESVFIPLVRVDFVWGNDTIFTTYTDSLGKFEYCDVPAAGKLSVKVAKRRFFSRIEAFEIDSLISDYIVDFKLYKSCDLQVCPAAVFEIDRHRKIQQLEIADLTELFEAYPTLCLKTVVGLYPGEAEKLAGKRIRTFRKTLLEKGVDIRRIHFSAEHVYTHPPELSGNIATLPSNYQPNISLLVQSMECDCE